MKYCGYCGIGFLKKPHQAPSDYRDQVFCSVKCSNTKRNKERAITEYPTKVCNHCKNIFQKDRRLSRSQWEKVQFCSNRCRGKYNDTGITDYIQKLRTGQRYVHWRTAVYQRDNYTCQMCGQVGGKLNADHIVPVKVLVAQAKLEKIFDLNNGRTLCVPCHKSTPSYGWKGAKLCV